MREVNSELAEKVRRENVRMHDRDSRIYDMRHAYMRDRAFQEGLRKDFALLKSRLGRHELATVLDCGAGTGNLSLKFLDCGWRVTALDISPGMLEVLRAKVRDSHARIETVEADVETYLRGRENAFDLVAFGATLHHLPDYLAALELACKALRPGGLLYVTGEPTLADQISPGERRLLRLDEYCNVFYKMAHHPRHIQAVLRKLLGLARTTEVDESLAEFHVDVGIDPDRCRAVLNAGGLTLLGFERLGYFGFRFVRLLAWLGRIELRSQFKLLAVKGSGANSVPIPTAGVRVELNWDNKGIDHGIF